MQEQDSKENDVFTEAQMKFCSQILSKLKKNRNAFPFLEPVDPIKHGVPDYPLIIKNPMDLGTVKKKLENRQYNNINEFHSDMKLIFNNCYTFNAPESDVYLMAKALEKVYDQLYNNPQGDMSKKRKKVEVIVPERRTGKRTIRNNDSMRIDDYEFCVDVINEICKPKYKSFVWPFLEPVDETLLPQYYEVIKNPIDIKTIKEKLDSKVYQNVDEFSSDLRLMVINCHIFNEKGSEVYKCGEELNKLITDLLLKYEPKDIRGRIIELKEKVVQYIAEIKALEAKLKNKNESVPVIKNYTLNDRIELGNRILNLNKVHTENVARILQKHSACEYVENNEIEVDLKILPDHVYEEIDSYISKIEIGIEDNKDDILGI